MDKDGIVFDGLPMGMRGGAMSAIARGAWQWVPHRAARPAAAADAEFPVEPDDLPMSASIKGYERLGIR
jgi:hypothetical protein